MESIIFRTLLHSLWQGVLLAILTALVVLFTTKSAAKLRYNLFVGCLLLFVFSVAVTFVIEFDSYNSKATAVTSAIVNSGHTETTLRINIGTAHSNVFTKVLDVIVDYTSKNSSSIVLIWFLMIVAKSIKLMIDIRTLVQIRTNKVYAAGSFLENKVSVLAAQYGVKQAVGILQSGLIKVPMVMGHFKPLILVPLGLVNGLSADEVDAILSHELAHIKRRDYLVNLFQSMVEILFFFNPAVLWLSNLIRAERENCCDDLAVSGTKTKLDYIKALVSCQEFASEVPVFAMAVTGKKKHLINRVQRLISARNQSLNKIEKAIVGVVLVFSVVLTTAFSGGPVIRAKAMPQINKTHKVTKTSAPLTDEKITLESLKLQQDIYSELVREGLIADNGNVSFKLSKDEFIINGVKQPAAIHQKYMKKYLSDSQKVINYVKSTDSRESTVAVHKGKRSKSTTEATSAVSEHPETPAVPRVPAVAERAKVAESAKAAQSAVAAERAVPAKPVLAKKDMTTDLIAEGLIKDKKNLSYQLNKDELVIDGVQQPEAIHRKYMRKYLQHDGQKITVSVSTD